MVIILILVGASFFTVVGIRARRRGGTPAMAIQVESPVPSLPTARWRVGPEVLAWFTLAGVVVYVGIDVLLRFLRPEYSLIYNAESDYGRGPWYWVMDFNFLLRCALFLSLAGALSQKVRHDPRIRTGLTLLVIWAACSGLLAFFADNPEGQPVTASGVVHAVLAFVCFACVTVAPFVISSRLRSDPTWQLVATALFAVSLLGAAAVLVFGAVRGNHGPRGSSSASSWDSSFCGAPLPLASLQPSEHEAYSFSGIHHLGVGVV